MRKLFSLEEARTILPEIKKLVNHGMLTHAALEQVNAEMIFISRALENGIDIKELTRRRIRADELEENLRDIAMQIHQLGVVIKGLNPVTIDFPARLNGELVWLCWTYGEETIEYYHPWNEGFKSRRKIEKAFHNEIGKY